LSQANPKGRAAGSLHAPSESDNVRADIEEVTGSRDSDVLTGSDLAHNTLRRSGGDDTLGGLAGDDWLIGYAGADTLLGGPDDDLDGADGVARNDSLDGNVGRASDAGDTETGCEA
jgi:Ca2+-binding RTX toxin-like protein